MMIAHQTIDGTKAAGQFEGIDEIGFPGNGDFYHVVAHQFSPHAQCQTRGAMVHEVEKAIRPKLTDKNQSGRFNH